MDPVLISPPPSRKSSFFEPLSTVRTQTLTIPGNRPRKNSHTSVRKISHGSEVLFVGDKPHDFIRGPGHEFREDNFSSTKAQIQDTNCSCSSNHLKVSPYRSFKDEEIQDRDNKQRFTYRLIASLCAIIWCILLVAGKLCHYIINPVCILF